MTSDHETGSTPANPAHAATEAATASEFGVGVEPVAGTWRERYRAQEHGRRRLAERYGSILQKQWAVDPNAPRVDALSLLYAFLFKAGPAVLRSPELEHAPHLERDDAIAAAHMIRVARDDARYRETAVMRHVVAHGVTWGELAHLLDTTPEELQGWLRRHGEQPDTWTRPGGPSSTDTTNL
ncbi:hypothetical protein KIPE111705_06930 [Kibdelosporangium persicum]|uniref:Uncharacterized protein n=1 Tax=Kibdelosporangium persicum TaxID=2698649 RepID=A0ABX2FJ02_9PSEU|nr:hypothetical protein [Kibdelosporangium persicum]NRN71393.1 hypothetical protein [Kibdelosporangium persicum]